MYPPPPQGRSQDLAGGPIISPCALLGGFGGMLPRENLKKWSKFARFGVYFGSDFVFKKILKLPFFIYNFYKLPFFT